MNANYWISKVWLWLLLANESQHQTIWKPFLEPIELTTMLTQNGARLSPASPTKRLGKPQLSKGVKAVLTPADSKQQQKKQGSPWPTPGIAQLVSKLWRYESNKQTSQLLLDDLARRTAERAKEVSDSVNCQISSRRAHIWHIRPSRHCNVPWEVVIDNSYGVLSTSSIKGTGGSPRLYFSPSSF